MRNVFLALVLANFGFAAWSQWFAPRPQATRLATQLGPRIALANEPALGGVELTEPGSAQRPRIDATPTPRDCISIGPFPNRVVVADMTRELDRAGYNGMQRIAQGDVWLGYWVYIDAIPTQAEAAAIVDNLAANRISEAYVIADADNGNLVSLGVFSVLARAEQRLNEATDLGYSPVIVDRSQPGDVYWLDVTADDGEAFTADTLLAAIDQEAVQLAECGPR